MNMTIDQIKNDHTDTKTKLGHIMTYVEAHPFETHVLHEIGVFPGLHPRLTNISNFETRLTRMIKARYNKTIPFIVHRKLQKFGTVNRVSAPILAIKCEKDNVVELKELLIDLTKNKLIGIQATFLPHGIVNQLGRVQYKNLLIEHNKTVNEMKVLTMYDVEYEKLWDILYTLMTSPDEEQITIMQLLT